MRLNFIHRRSISRRGYNPLLQELLFIISFTEAFLSKHNWNWATRLYENSGKIYGFDARFIKRTNEPTKTIVTQFQICISRSSLFFHRPLNILLRLDVLLSNADRLSHSSQCNIRRKVVSTPVLSQAGFIHIHFDPKQRLKLVIKSLKWNFS